MCTTFWLYIATAALWITLGYFVARLVDDYREYRAEQRKVWKPGYRRRAYND